MSTLTDFIFHMNEWLRHFAIMHPTGIYMILFLILFSETAFFPLAPFLPGDGFLFAIGVLVSSGAIDIALALIVLILGALAGNLFAYWIGQKFGPDIFYRIRWLKQKHYIRAHEFYQEQGGNALIYSRFIPVISALVPLVAGVAKMNYHTFMKYSVLSVMLWVLLIVLGGYYLGHIPWVQNNFIWVVMGMACLSILSAIFVGLREMHKKKNRTA